MKKVVILICFFMLFPATIAFSGTSGFMLRNPPNSTGTWEFDGGQLIDVTFKNLNFLVGIVGYTVHPGTGAQSGVVILPFSSQNMQFSMFGTTPIHWSFDLSTPQDVTLVSITASWE